MKKLLCITLALGLLLLGACSKEDETVDTTAAGDSPSERVIALCEYIESVAGSLDEMDMEELQSIEKMYEDIPERLRSKVYNYDLVTAALYGYGGGTTMADEEEPPETDDTEYEYDWDIELPEYDTGNIAAFYTGKHPVLTFDGLADLQLISAEATAVINPPMADTYFYYYTTSSAGNTLIDIVTVITNNYVADEYADMILFAVLTDAEGTEYIGDNVTQSPTGGNFDEYVTLQLGEKAVMHLVFDIPEDKINSDFQMDIYDFNTYDIVHTDTFNIADYHVPPQQINLGETVRAEGYSEITPRSVNITDTLEPSNAQGSFSYLPAESGTYHFVVTAEVKNISADPINLSNIAGMSTTASAEEFTAMTVVFENEDGSRIEDYVDYTFIEPGESMEVMYFLPIPIEKAAGRIEVVINQVNQKTLLIVEGL